MKANKLTRKEREWLRHRKEILDVALRLFSQKGYHNVSMQEISKESEFSVGTLYNFFKSKEELYKTLILEHVDMFDEALSNAIKSGKDEIQKLRNYIKVKGVMFKTHAEMVRLYFAETRGASFNIMAGLDKEIKKRHKEFMEKLARIFRGGMKKRIFKNVADPFYLAVALDSMCNAFLFLWLDFPKKYPYPDEPDSILNIILHGLLLKK